MSAGQPSTLFLDHLDQLVGNAALGPVLDLACGRGRHALAAARAGLRVIGLDRNAESLDELAASARAEALDIRIVRADLETGEDFPIAAGSCGAILVFRYLHRPIAAALAAALAPGGLLLYETFTVHQKALGYGPGRDEFLLQPGELPGLFPELQVEHHWEGRIEVPREAEVARLVARRPALVTRRPA